MSLVGFIGCTNADPTVSNLGGTEIFSFLSSNITTADLSAVPLSAKCSTLVEKVELSFDSGITWIQSTTYDGSASANCSTGTFNITLSSTKSPWSSQTFHNGDILSIKFKVTGGSGAVVVYKTVSVTYTPPATIKQEMLAGAATQTGTGLVVKARLRALSQTTASGGPYIIKRRGTQ